MSSHDTGYEEKFPPEQLEIPPGRYTLTRDTSTFTQGDARFFNVRAPDGEIIGSIRTRTKEEARVISRIFSLSDNP